MFDNRLPADQMAKLEPGQAVVVETFGTGFGYSDIRTGKVARLTPTQVVVHYTAGDRTVESRFRRRDAEKVGEGRGTLLDPEHPRTADALAKARKKRRQSAIDSVAARWSRERDNLDLLRQLHVAVGEYLDAES